MGIYSMTGFGSAAADIGPWSVTVEVKSVNGRFLDIVTKLPQKLSALESIVQSEAKKHFKRGRLEVAVGLQLKSAAASSIKLNRELLLSAVAQVKAIIEEKGAADSGLETRLIEEMGTRREFFESDSGSEDPPGVELLCGTVEKAMLECRALREREGAIMVSELTRLNGLIVEGAGTVEKLAAPNKERALAKLKQRVLSIEPTVKIDDVRLLQEIAILIDRMDINEELVRLRSHCKLFKEIMDASEGGRKLEFTLQEMLREVNTLGSKSQDPEISKTVVAIKNYIENMKELVLNAE